MGRRIILSESEKLDIQNLYKGLLSEQQDELISKDNDGTESKDKVKQQNPRKYLPISDEFCDIRLGKAQVKKGAEGDLVKLFQEALINCGIKLPEFGVDGNFGNETREGVEEFQRREGLTIDGGIGIETSGKLCELGCIPKEVCSKCEGNKGNEKNNDMGTGFIEGRINVDCERVQGCISEFMGGLSEEFCVDEDKIKGLLQCVGIGQCFEGGEVTTVKEGCTSRNGTDLCSIPYKQLESGGNYTANVGYFYDPKSNSCVSRSMGGGPFSQKDKCIQCCVRK